MLSEDLAAKAKTLSRVLGLLANTPSTKAAFGWVEIAALLRRLGSSGTSISRAQLDEIVANDPRQRFVVSPDGARLRAVQGHTVAADSSPRAKSPPPVLYHGTGRKSLVAIMKNGLQPQNGPHVHLTASEDTAAAAGARHGTPVVLVIDAYTMQRMGVVFYQSENSVWLVESVPPDYIKQL